MGIDVIFWDIDGTLVRGSMERHFIRYLNEEYGLSWAKIAGRFLRLWRREGRKITWRTKAAYVRGFEVDELDMLIDDAWCRYFAPNLHHKTAAVVRRLADRGVTQVLLSGTLTPLAVRLGQSLGISDFIAAELEIRNGRYTGRLLAPHPMGRRKAEAATRWLAERGLEDAALCAVGNDFEDRHVLQGAALAVAMNADRGLRRYATKAGYLRISEKAGLDMLQERLFGEVSGDRITPQGPAASGR